MAISLSPGKTMRAPERVKYRIAAPQNHYHLDVSKIEGIRSLCYVPSRLLGEEI